jgi:hypothetical protein
VLEAAATTAFSRLHPEEEESRAGPRGSERRGWRRARPEAADEQ